MGDILFTTNNKVLIDKYRPLPALDCQQRKAPKVIPTEDDIAKSNKKGFKNKVGSITNIGTSMLNLQSKFTKDSKEWDELEYRVICIQHFQQLSIDSVKGIRMTPMNPQWDKLSKCLPDEGDNIDTVELKKFNKNICAYRKPYFFIYRYSTTKAEYDQYIKKVDSKLKQKYHISLDELLSMDNLTEELEIEREYFYNKCPVDMSPGTINRIAWAVNKKFVDFNELPTVSFNKELIKSDEQYTMSEFHMVRDVYREYEPYIENLVKRTENCEISDDDEMEGPLDKSIIDLMFKGRFHEVCSNDKKLCNILIDLLYDKPNSKGVVWDMCGDVIIDNLLEKSDFWVEYPEIAHDDAEFGCCRKKFKMVSVNVGGESYGEI